ncbi:14129_t:CDS:1, partial [Dentiscutata erythropus]
RLKSTLNTSHTTRIHRLNPKAHNSEAQLGSLIFRLLAAEPDKQKSKFT